MSSRYFSTSLGILLLQIIAIYCKVPANKTLHWTPDVKVDHIECWFDQDVFSHGNCKVEFIDRYTQLVSATCTIMVPQSSLRVHMTLFYKFQVQYRKFLIEIDADMCNYPNEHPLLALATPIIQSYSNFVYKCPYQGNLTINRVKVDSRFLPNTVMPSGNYRLDMRLYYPNTNKTVIAELKMYGTVPQSRNAHEDRSMG